MCPHTTAAYGSSYYCYVCVLILLRYVSPKAAAGAAGLRDAASMLLTKPLCYELRLYATAIYTQEPLRALPGFAMQLVQAAVSLKRLREFLAAQDLAVVQQAEKLGIVA